MRRRFSVIIISFISFLVFSAVLSGIVFALQKKQQAQVQKRQLETKENLEEASQNDQQAREEVEFDQKKEGVFYGNSGDALKKVNLGRFNLIYPQDWHWIEEDLPFGGFVTNNVAVSWTTNKIEPDMNDVVLGIASESLSPYSENIVDVVERLDYEIKYDINSFAKKYPSMTCTKNTTPQFDVEYECRYNKDGVYRRSIDIGISDGTQECNRCGKYSVTAASKNLDLIERFSIEKNF